MKESLKLKIFELRNQGLSYRKIARRLSVGFHTILKVLREGNSVAGNVAQRSGARRTASLKGDKIAYIAQKRCPSEMTSIAKKGVADLSNVAPIHKPFLSESTVHGLLDRENSGKKESGTGSSTDALLEKNPKPIDLSGSMIKGMLDHGDPSTIY